MVAGLTPVALHPIGLDYNFPQVPPGEARCEGNGAVAQLGERLICIQEVAGSIPTSSTSLNAGPVAQLARAHP